MCLILVCFLMAVGIFALILVVLFYNYGEKMNVKLNNQLVEAVNIFTESGRRFDAPIREYERAIAEAKKRIDSDVMCANFIPKPQTPEQMDKKQRTSMILLLLFVWPVGIPYAIYFSRTKEKREKQNNETYVAEMTEYNRKIEDFRQCINEENRKIAEIKQQIEKLEAQKQNFFQQNSEALAFLPRRCRYLGMVERLYHFIHEEYDYTLQDAINRYDKEEKELSELQERIEARERAEELAERHHRELKKSLDDVAYYQKRAAEEQRMTNENLDRIHQDNVRNGY